MSKMMTVAIMSMMMGIAAILCVAAEPAQLDDARRESKVNAGGPLKKKLFANEKWYRDVHLKEQPYEGILRKEPSPMATSGRWNPVRLIIDEKTTWEVYLGADTGVLDDYIGLNVRIVGKPQVVLGHREIWPAHIEIIPQTKDRENTPKKL